MLTKIASNSSVAFASDKKSIVNHIYAHCLIKKDKPGKYSREEMSLLLCPSPWQLCERFSCTHCRISFRLFVVNNNTGSRRRTRFYGYLDRRDCFSLVDKCGNLKTFFLVLIPG